MAYPPPSSTKQDPFAWGTTPPQQQQWHPQQQQQQNYSTQQPSTSWANTSGVPQQQWNVASTPWQVPTTTSSQPNPWNTSTSSAWNTTSNTWPPPAAAAAPAAVAAPTSSWSQQQQTSSYQNTSSAWPVTNSTMNNDPWSNTSAVNTSTSSWPAPSTSAWPDTTSTAAGTGWQNASYSAGNTSYQASRQQQIANPFEFSAIPAPSTTRPLDTSFNPFDITNDDAGFFINTTSTGPAKKGNSQQQKQTPKASPPPTVDTTPPPSATTQRLLRVASMLFERGTLIKADKIFIQELCLRGDKKALAALENAELDGNVERIQQILLAERKKQAGGGGNGSDDSEDERAEAAANSFKSRKSIARKNSDEEEEQTEDVGGPRKQSFVVKEGIEAPHPHAGGFTGVIPPSMGVSRGQFIGNILVRISSKKMFRKWKPGFFAIDKTRVMIFDSRLDWENGRSPRMVVPLHECMWIAKPTLKKTYSLIDDGRRVYFSTLKENSQGAIAAATMNGMDRPDKFSPALEARVVAKFASHYPDEISAFAHAIYSVVLLHQKEARQGVRSNRQASSGFGGN